MCKKQFKIEYQSWKFGDNPYEIEFIIVFILVQLGSLIFVLVNNMFVEDLIGALAFVLMPATCFVIYLLVFLLSRCELTFDYQNMQLVKKKLFVKKIYDLNKIKTKRMGNHPVFFKVYLYFGDKLICKIDSCTFENNTGFTVDYILNE